MEIFLYIIVGIFFVLIFFLRKNNTALIDFSLDSLQERYDNGEISKEKFEQMKEFINKESEQINKLIS